MEALADPASTVTDLWDRVLARAEDLPDWSLDTPCADWDVHDVLAHLSALQLLFDRGHDPEPPDGWTSEPTASALDQLTERGVAARRDWSREQVLDELAEARDSHRRAVAATEDWDAPAQGPVGPTTAAGLLQNRLFDLWVHLQDLHLAVGETIDVHDRSAAAEVAQRFVVDRLGWMAVKRCGFPDGTTLRLRLAAPVNLDTVLAVHGGRGHFDETADPGICFVQGHPAAFTLLCAGRRTPAEWAAEGLLEWGGPRGEELVERARLF